MKHSNVHINMYLFPLLMVGFYVWGYFDCYFACKAIMDRKAEKKPASYIYTPERPADTNLSFVW
jgi:hypothetical protein